MAVQTCSPPALPLMTEEEFEAWCTRETRAEFRDGKVIVMSPVSRDHAGVNRFLIQLVGLYVQSGPGGELVGPEEQVRLRPGLRRVPDLAYLAPDHLERIHETRIEGAPDIVWEIVSPESQARDWRDKFDEYQELGVREYWLVDPVLETVWLYRRGDAGKFQEVQAEDGIFRSGVLEGFWLKPEWLWQRPRVIGCLREMGVSL